MENVVKKKEIWNRRIQKGRIKRWMEGVIEKKKKNEVQGRRMKVKYMKKVKKRKKGLVV